MKEAGALSNKQYDYRPFVNEVKGVLGKYIEPLNASSSFQWPLRRFKLKAEGVSCEIIQIDLRFPIYAKPVQSHFSIANK